MFGFNLGSLKAILSLDITDWRRKHKTAKEDVRALGREMTALGAAITGMAGFAVKEFGTFDKAIRESTAVTTGLMQEEFEQMSKMALDASVRLNKAATETATGFYFLGSAGLSATEQMQAYNDTIMMSRALTETVGKTAEGLVDVMKGFNIPFSETNKVANILTKTVITSNQVFSDLDKAMSYVSGTARKTNNSLAETAAMIGIMADAGIKGSMSGVSFRRALTNLMSPTGEMRDLMYELGIAIYDTEGKMTPFVDVFKDIAGKIRDTSEQYQNMVFEVLFGRRAIAGMLQIFQLSNEEIDAVVRNLENFGTTMEDVTGWQMKAFLHQLGRIWQQARRLSITIGSLLAPSIAKFGDFLKVRLGTLEAWIVANKELVFSLTKSVALFGGLMLIIGPALYVLPNLVTSVAMLSGAFIGLIGPMAVIVGTMYALRAVWNDSINDMGDFSEALKTIGKTAKHYIIRIMWDFSLLPKAASIYLERLSEIFRLTFAQIKLYMKGHIIEAFAMNESIRKLHSPENMFAPIFGTDQERNESFNKYKADLNSVFVFAKDLAIKEARTIGGSIKSQFGKDMLGIKAAIAKFLPDLMALFEIFSGKPIKLNVGLVAPSIDFSMFEKFRMPDMSELSKLLSVKTPSRFSERWKFATMKTLEDFTKMGEAIGDVFSDMQTGWETAFKDLMQDGSKLSDFFDTLFDSIYQSFVNFVAKMMSQQLIQSIFGENYLTTNLSPATLIQLIKDLSSGQPGVAPAIFPAFQNPGLSGLPPDRGMLGDPRLKGAGKVVVNFDNMGPPMDVELDSTNISGETLVLNATMKLAETNTNFRRTFVNNG